MIIDSQSLHCIDPNSLFWATLWREIHERGPLPVSHTCLWVFQAFVFGAIIIIDSHPLHCIDPNPPLWATLWREVPAHKSPPGKSLPIDPMADVRFNPKMRSSQLLLQLIRRKPKPQANFLSAVSTSSSSLLYDGHPSASPRTALPCGRGSSQPDPCSRFPPLRPPCLPLRHPRLAAHHEGSPWQVVGRKREEGNGGPDSICLGSTIKPTPEE